MDIKKENIKIRVTPEQSKKVQEICFELGIYWINNEKTEFNTSANYLYIISSSLQWGIYEEDFELADEKEVSAEKFIQTKGFTKCSICGESKQDCPREESCSYKIKDTEEESLTESQIEDLEQLGIDKVGLRKETTEEDTPKNNFKEYGFEADFEGEIYEKYQVFDMEFFTGYIWEKPKEDYPSKRLITWTKEGEPTHYHIAEEEQVRIYKLNPIKKPWYETPNQFKVMMLKEDLGWYPNIFYSEDYLKAGINEMKVTEGKEWRYASKEEIYSLYQGEENNE